MGKYRIMNDNKKETLIWDNIPEWAIFSLEYGIGEELFLSNEDKEMITRFIAENYPNGYTMSVDWESYKEFDRYPAFGKPCKTYTVKFCNIESMDMRKITLSEHNAIPKGYCGIWNVERLDLPD